MSPRLAGTRYHWDIKPNQVLIIDLEGNKLEGDGEISRESKVHFALLREYYPLGNAVIHSHTPHVLVFCAAERPIPPVLESTRKFGEIPLCSFRPSGSNELADQVVETMRPRKDIIPKGGAAVLMPRHGLVVMGKDLYTAFDSTERIDTNAALILQGAALGGIEPFLEVPKGMGKGYDE